MTISANKNNSLILKIVTADNDKDDDEDLERFTRQLRQEIQELDVEDVHLIKCSNESPPGSKSGEVAALGSLLVTLASSSGLLTSITDIAKSWLTRHERNTITLEMDGDKLQISGISSDNQQKLIESWIDRHKQKNGR